MSFLKMEITKILCEITDKLEESPIVSFILGDNAPKMRKTRSKAKIKSFEQIKSDVQQNKYNNIEAWANDIRILFNNIHVSEDFDDPIKKDLNNKLNDLLKKHGIDEWNETLMHYKLKLSQLMQNPPIILSPLQTLVFKMQNMKDSQKNSQILQIIKQYQPELIKSTSIEKIDLVKLYPETIKSIITCIDQK